jgi:hypothetical protein
MFTVQYTLCTPRPVQTTDHIQVGIVPATLPTPVLYHAYNLLIMTAKSYSDWAEGGFRYSFKNIMFLL